jgi:hypothetical protein
MPTPKNTVPTTTTKEESREVGANETPSRHFRKFFKQVNKPEEEPKLPKEISKLSAEKLSDLLNHYSAWREFAEDLQVEALVDYTQKLESYNFSYDKTFLIESKNSKSVKEADAKVSTSLQIRNLYLDLQSAELYNTLMSKKVESLSNVIAIISREITRRGNNF